MKIAFERGEQGKVTVISDLRNEQSSFGKRGIAEVPITHNISWYITWYAPGAYATPHMHPRSESVYNFSFMGSGGKCAIYLGWPLSKARLTEITKSSLVYIPAYEYHCFVNTGDADMMNVHAFSPHWKNDLYISHDLIEAVNGKEYLDIDEYSKYIEENDKKFPTFNDFVTHLKENDKY
jgi:oxalate decarboxylase/phosphoglucose isomerase-like protein (cupin superfamily)